MIFDVPDFLDGATEELQNLARGDTTTLALSAAGYSYVAELFAAVTRKRGTLSEGVKNYLFSHFDEPLSLDSIAAVFGHDRFSLCRRFKEETGESVMATLLSIRITKAKRMLRYTTEPIERVGRLSGFESPSYFIKRFGGMIGCTPKEYRRRYLGL